jgi:hypothetical protein
MFNSTAQCQSIFIFLKTVFLKIVFLIFFFLYYKIEIQFFNSLPRSFFRYSNSHHYLGALRGERNRKGFDSTGRHHNAVI